MISKNSLPLLRYDTFFFLLSVLVVGWAVGVLAVGLSLVIRRMKVTWVPSLMRGRPLLARGRVGNFHVYAVASGKTAVSIAV